MRGRGGGRGEARVEKQERGLRGISLQTHSFYWTGEFSTTRVGFQNSIIWQFLFYLGFGATNINVLVGIDSLVGLIAALRWTWTGVAWWLGGVCE